MTAQVLENLFAHQHNSKEVAWQEYEAAKQHFREICRSRVIGDPEHHQRFRDAMDRQELAREAWQNVLQKEKR
ncbi:hypothetical protein [Fimbriiglobus ruber]|uniref:Uncharacterized protein n=1 Tax=Fimbriiglobus ruber TaxID=1908690 RepID=A0A225DRA1_9BACT|nr:hypothetical protein [Fimbriiglobus ruber]OWK42164.1 hypothetical protein FRUB_04242 [Fimbriiglobus ruber]